MHYEMPPLKIFMLQIYLTIYKSKYFSVADRQGQQIQGKDITFPSNIRLNRNSKVPIRRNTAYVIYNFNQEYCSIIPLE